MPITAEEIADERAGARAAATSLTAGAAEATVLAAQVAALSQACGGEWEGASADAFRGFTAELGDNAAGIADGYLRAADALELHAEALDALHRRVDRAEKDLEKAERAVEDAEDALVEAQHALRSARDELSRAAHAATVAALDPTSTTAGAAQDRQRAAHAAVGAAERALQGAREDLSRARKRVSDLEDDLDDLTREHRDAADACADEVMSARDVPFHVRAYEVVRAIGKDAEPQWTDWVDPAQGIAVSAATAADRYVRWAASRTRSLTDVARSFHDHPSPAFRAIAANREAELLRRYEKLRKAGRVTSRLPRWIRFPATPVTGLFPGLSGVPGLRHVPGLAVPLTVYNTAKDAEELGLAHSAAKNVGATAAGIGAAVLTGAAIAAAPVAVPAVLVVGAGIVVGTGASIIAGAAIENADEIRDAAVDTAEDIGKGVGEGIEKGVEGLKDGADRLKGLVGLG